MGTRPDTLQYLFNKRSAQRWVEAVLDETLHKDEDFFNQLMDGVVLCKVMQRLSPSLIPRIKMPVAKRRGSLFVFRITENVTFFLQACKEIGVPRHRRFQPTDLVHTHKDQPIAYASARRVLDCLETLCEVTCKGADLYTFSAKWPALEKEKEKFSKDEIKTADMLIDAYVKTEQQKIGVHLPEKRFADTIRLSQVEILRIQEEDKANKAATKLQALVKGWIARTRFREMVLDQAYRDRVAHEIYSTEKVYVEHLEFVFKQILLPLRNSQDTNNPILTEIEIRAIFSELEVLLNYNNLLLVQLEQRVAKWGVHQRLGDIFLQIASYLKIYSQYVSNYNEAMRILAECKKQSRFKKFLEDLKKKNSELDQCGLENFLIRPVQRIPRYFLLLQELFKHTSKDHPDYANLAAATQKVQAVAEYMNDKKREAENIMKVSEIQEMIEGEFEPLAAPHRRFVKEAQLQEVSKGTTRKHTVVVFLFNDLLIVTKTQGSFWLSRKKGQRLIFSTSFRLNGSRIVALDDTPGFQNAFVFIRNTSNRSVTLLSGTKEARDDWVTAIQKEIEDATEHEEAQDERITNMVTERVADAKLKLERLMSSVTDSNRLKGSLEDMSAPLSSSSGYLSSSSGLSATASGDSSDDAMTPRRSMTLKEKRLALMNQAKKHGSGGGLVHATFSVSENCS